MLDGCVQQREKLLLRHLFSPKSKQRRMMLHNTNTKWMGKKALWMLFFSKYTIRKFLHHEKYNILPSKSHRYVHIYVDIYSIMYHSFSVLLPSDGMKHPMPSHARPYHAIPRHPAGANSKISDMGQSLFRQMFTSPHFGHAPLSKKKCYIKKIIEWHTTKQERKRSVEKCINFHEVNRKLQSLSLHSRPY